MISPGTRVRLPSGVTGYVSARLAGGMLGVICAEGYIPVPADRVTVLGPDPVQWDRHEHLRQYGR